MTIKQIIEEGANRLKESKIEEPKIKARILIQHILKKPRQYLIINDEKELEKKLEDNFLKKIDEIKKGIPLEYTINEKEFMKLCFYVDENVLIPRQDTEILVEEVIKIAKENNCKKILDLCTGSGCIAISIAKYIENSNITAIDVSKKAIEIAKKNAKENKVEKQIKFIESNLFEKIGNEKYDIIVSNPPYIKTSIIENLSKEVQNEPHIALDGGEDGLEFYREIIKNSYKYLNKNGYLCLEIGYDQKEEVTKLIEQEKMYENVYCKKDLGLNDRAIISHKVK